MCVGNRRWMRSTGHQSCKVRHVDQKKRANFIRNLAHTGEIDNSRISAATTNNQLRMLRRGDLLQFVVIDGLRFLGHAVRNYLVRFARKIQMMTMRKVSAVR